MKRQHLTDEIYSSARKPTPAPAQAQAPVLAQAEEEPVKRTHYFTRRTLKLIEQEKARRLERGDKARANATHIIRDAVEKVYGRKARK